jgi:DNA-binding Xre family transcriptional regulator
LFIYIFAAFLLVFCRFICYSEIQRVSVVYILADYRTPQSSAKPAELLCILGGKPMAVSYKKLWKILIDKDIKKKDLSAIAGISPATITKMGRNGHVTTEVLLKICTALNCGIDDIMEVTLES